MICLILRGRGGGRGGEGQDLDDRGLFARGNLPRAKVLTCPALFSENLLLYLRANARSAAEIQNRHQAPVSIPASGIRLMFMIGSYSTSSPRMRI